MTATTGMTRARRLLLQCSIACLLAGVLVAARGCGPSTPSDAAWSAMSGPYPEMLFSVWGTSPKDVWAVGGRSGTTVACDAGMCEGTPSPLILRYDGTIWRSLASPRATILWWVFGFSPSDVWVAGEKGVMLHWDGSALTDVPTEAAPDVKLFGVWGAAPNDVWAVGGVPDGSATILHWNGTTFSTVKDAPQVSVKGGTWYKVWGSAADDVYVVGQRGALVHWDGKAWSRVDLSATGVTVEPLFTVAGAGKNDVWAVGGIGVGVALHYDGKAWTPAAGLKLDTAAGLTGVFENATGDVVITGMAGAKFVGKLGAFRDDTSQKPHDDLHAVWFQTIDNVFAAGGNFFAVRDGIIARYGK